MGRSRSDLLGVGRLPIGVGSLRKPLPAVGNAPVFCGEWRCNALHAPHAPHAFYVLPAVDGLHAFSAISAISSTNAIGALRRLQGGGAKHVFSVVFRLCLSALFAAFPQSAHGRFVLSLPGHSALLISLPTAAETPSAFGRQRPSGDCKATCGPFREGAFGGGLVGKQLLSKKDRTEVPSSTAALAENGYGASATAETATVEEPVALVHGKARAVTLSVARGAVLTAQFVSTTGVGYCRERQCVGKHSG